MLLGIPEAAWVLRKWMLEVARFIQVYPPLRSSDPNPKIPPQNPSLSTGNAPKFQEF